MKIFSILSEVGLTRFGLATLQEIYRIVVRNWIFGSFSQNYEDLQIEKYLHKKTGSYIEIGAYHPFRLSNTYRFYKKGWQGIVVEPNPDIEQSFMEYRPNDLYINKGVGIMDGQMNYYKYNIPALNTFSEDQVMINEANGYSWIERVSIPIVGIKKFLKMAPKKVDILSLDIEGWDYQILKNWNWKIKPKIICVETNERSGEIDKLLFLQKYKKEAENKINSIYVLR